VTVSIVVVFFRTVSDHHPPLARFGKGGLSRDFLEQRYTGIYIGRSLDWRQQP
jgi:hypothetical protein